MKKNLLILLILQLLYAPRVHAQLTNIDSLQKIVVLQKHDDTEMKALFLLASVYARTDVQKAKTYLHQNITLASKAENYESLCKAFALLLTFHQEEGNTDSAALDVSKLQEIAIKDPGNKKVQANYNQSMGLYHRKNGSYKAALPFCLAAISYTEALNTAKSSLAGQWLNAGATYDELGDYGNSLNCYLKALRLFIDDGSKLGESFCYTNVAAVYINLKQFDKALTYAKQGLELKKSLADKRGICTSLDAIGNAYIGLKNGPAALTNFRAALKIALEEKMVSEEAGCYLSMAKIFAQQKKDSVAAVYFNKAKAAAAKMKNPTMEADAAIGLSALDENDDSTAKQENILATSLQTFKDAGSLEKEAENYRSLSAIHAEKKEFDKALQYSNKYHGIIDSIRNNELKVQLAKIENQYAVEKKEQEIVLLKKDKELQAQKLFRQRLLFAGAGILLLLSLVGMWLLVNRNKLKQRMKELEFRNQIAADLHDEVGSSLSSIHMLSQMASQQGGDARHKDILFRMSNNAKETMDKMGDIVWMIKPGETEAASLKQRMERFAFEISSSKNISLQLALDEMEKLKLSMDQRKNIWLIFKEAINNAVKYSDTETLEVTAILQNKEIILQVKDYGKGFNSNVVRIGNGLNNMHRRAKELHGKLVIQSNTDTGTTIQLVVPV